MAWSATVASQTSWVAVAVRSALRGRRCGTRCWVHDTLPQGPQLVARSRPRTHTHAHAGRWIGRTHQSVKLSNLSRRCGQAAARCCLCHAAAVPTAATANTTRRSKLGHTRQPWLPDTPSRPCRLSHRQLALPVHIELNPGHAAMLTDTKAATPMAPPHTRVSSRDRAYTTGKMGPTSQQLVDKYKSIGLTRASNITDIINAVVQDFTKPPPPTDANRVSSSHANTWRDGELGGRDRVLHRLRDARRELHGYADRTADPVPIPKWLLDRLDTAIRLLDGDHDDAEYKRRDALCKLYQRNVKKRLEAGTLLWVSGERYGANPKRPIPPACKCKDKRQPHPPCAAELAVPYRRGGGCDRGGERRGRAECQ